MSKSQDAKIYIRAKDQLMLARFQVATARQGKTPSECFGAAMELWLKSNAPELLQ